MLCGFFPVRWKVSVSTAPVVSSGMRTDSNASRHAECHSSPVSSMARIAPVSISPAAEAALERIGFLPVFLVDDFPDKFAGPLRAGRVFAANCTHGRHHTLAECSLLGLVVRMVVAA